MRCSLAAIFVFAVLCSRACCQDINAVVAPFDSSRSGGPQLGLKTAMILNLQIWQTLRVPPNKKAGGNSGKVLWLQIPHLLTSVQDAQFLAKYAQERPQLVLWGRAWQYGGGTVVEAFLHIRPENSDGTPAQLWSLSLAPNNVLSVTVPRSEVEFEPLIIRTDLLGELQEVSGLKLYADQDSDIVLGTVGNAFRALKQKPEEAKVALPSGMKGWVRLPNLSSTHSEVVDFVGGVIRALRHDWPGALELLGNVVNTHEAPNGVKVDAYLYMAIAADGSGGEAYNWVKQAYTINPYSKSVVQYLCMSKVAQFNRLSATAKAGSSGAAILSSLRQIVEARKILFAPGDPWLAKVRSFLSSRGQ
jgi:hypothetical protein